MPNVDDPLKAYAPVLDWCRGVLLVKGHLTGCGYSLAEPSLF